MPKTTKKESLEKGVEELKEPIQQEENSCDSCNFNQQERQRYYYEADNYVEYEAPHDKFTQGLFYCLFLNVFALWVCALMYEKRTKERLTFISGWVTCAFILFVFSIIFSIVVAYLLREGIIKWPWYW